jgi:hypothetical protein
MIQDAKSANITGSKAYSGCLQYPLVIAVTWPLKICGGYAVYSIGVLLHFFIALFAAGIYFVASRKLDFLTGHPFVCGLFYCIVVFLVMNLIVLRLSDLSRDYDRPFGAYAPPQSVPESFSYPPYKSRCSRPASDQ